MTEYTQITDVSIYLNQYRFDAAKWLRGEISSDQVFCQFVKFVIVLGLSHPEVRKELRIDAVELPQATDSIHLMEELVEQLKETESIYRPDKELLISHLLIPYIFPYAMTVLSAVDMLSDAGLKSLGLKALQNVEATVEPSIEQNIIRSTPTGSFKEKEEAGVFLSFIADGFRESFGKTYATSQVIEAESLSEVKKFITTKDDSVRKSVLQGLRDWFKPHELPTIERANWLLSNEDVILEEPKLYLQRRATLQKHKNIIYQSLIRT